MKGWRVANPIEQGHQARCATIANGVAPDIDLLKVNS